MTKRDKMRMTRPRLSQTDGWNGAMKTLRVVCVSLGRPHVTNLRPSSRIPMKSRSESCRLTKSVWIWGIRRSSSLMFSRIIVRFEWASRRIEMSTLSLTETLKSLCRSRMEPSRISVSIVKKNRSSRLSGGWSLITRFISPCACAASNSALISLAPPLSPFQVAPHKPRPDAPRREPKGTKCQGEWTDEGGMSSSSSSIHQE